MSPSKSPTFCTIALTRQTSANIMKIFSAFALLGSTFAISTEQAGQVRGLLEQRLRSIHVEHGSRFDCFRCYWQEKLGDGTGGSSQKGAREQAYQFGHPQKVLGPQTPKLRIWLILSSHNFATKCGLEGGGSLFYGNKLR